MIAQQIADLLLENALVSLAALLVVLALAALVVMDLRVTDSSLDVQS